MKAATFHNTNELTALDGWLADSHTAPVIIFKHSVTCSISADVYREVSGYGGAIGLVVVQTARPLSNEIAARTGVRHESPQALVLRHGRVVWHASHYDITAAGLQRVVQENQ